MKKVNNSNEEKNKEKKSKIILIIITIIIIILALITSCSCTSKFWGRIGDLFRNEEIYVFKEQNGALCETNLQCETIINKDLRFEKDSLDISVSDENIPLTYIFNEINPHEFTCTTSDANIATCYVNKSGYVVIIPKNQGTITLFLQTEENDRIYQATAIVNIGEPNKKIVLASNSGTINLTQTRTKTVPYSLVGINGDITVVSSNEKIATATIKDGILKMTAYKTGKVIFTITVEDNGVTYTTEYTLTVINKINGNSGGNSEKDPNNNQNKSGNNKLSSLTTNKGMLSPKFKEDTKNYQIRVSENDNDIILKATPASDKATVTYTFNGKTNTTGQIEGLAPGENVVTIMVTAEDGSINIYTVTIIKPGTPPTIKYDIKFDNDYYECYLEYGTCLIKYSVFKDGNEIFDYKASDIKVNLPDSYKNKVTATIGTGDKLGYVILTPKNTKEMLNKEVDLTISVNGTPDTTKIKFISQNYYLQSFKNEYDMSIDSESKTRPIVFQTNLFNYIGNNPEELIVESANNGKSITITSRKDSNIYLHIWTNSTNITKISYDSKSGTTYLPIIIEGKAEGEAHIFAQGSAFGQNIPNQALDIKINIIQKYIVKLKAGTGIFNEFTKEYEFKISSKEEIDLTPYNEPILIIDGDECYYYKFLGYALEGTEDIIYYKDNQGKWNKPISGITANTNFIAIYSTEKLNRDTTPKTMWLVDVPLFHNEEYYRKYGEDKIIYPGAKGTYTMIFKNETSDDITLTGMVLEEDTICVDINNDGKKDGCINIGYIIRDNTANYNYLLGSFVNNQNNYFILHQNGTLNNDSDIPKTYTYRHEWWFNNNTANDLTIKANSKDNLEITILWEWQYYIDDENDKIDTAIGNQAAKVASNKNLNDLYKLKVGIKYNINRVCKNN